MKHPMLRLSVAVAALLLATTASSDDCAGQCHIIKPYVESLEQPHWLAAKHNALGLTCTDCHPQDAQTRRDEHAAYDAGHYDEPMFQREFDDDFCFRCHDSKEAVAELTHHLHEEWGINPHEDHQQAECYECHNAHRPSTFICSECHLAADWEQRLPTGWTAR